MIFFWSFFSGLQIAQVWYVNYRSCFGHCQIFIHFFSYFPWPINCMSWMFLNYVTYFSWSIIYIWHLLVFSFMESSILTITLVCSFFLVIKFCKSGLEIIHLIWAMLDFWVVLKYFVWWNILKYFELRFLTLIHLVIFHIYNFLSVNCTSRVCISQHIWNIENVSLEGF